MLRTNTTPSLLEMRNPTLANLLSRETMPVTRELKRASNVDLLFANRVLTLTEPPTKTIASQERLKGSELKTHLGGMRTGDHSSLKEPVRAGWARDQNEVANLSRGNWPGSQIYDIKLRERDFTNENLANRQYQNVDLGKSNFEAANLSGARFKNTNLSQCDFLGAVLTNLCCKGVLFIGARVGGTIIESGRYSDCNFGWAELSNVHCDGVNFSGTNFFEAKLKSVNFSGCDFTGAYLTNLDIDEVDFRGSNLSNAAMSLSQECVEDSLRAPIIYTPGPDDSVPKNGIGNLLNAIDSIDPEHQEQKNALMRSLIDRMDKVEWQHVMLLARVLFKDSGYDGDPVIARFNEKLLIPWLQLKERQPPLADEFDMTLMNNLVNRHPERTREWATTYRKTLTLYEGRALSDPQTASLQTPAITGGTARS